MYIDQITLENVRCFDTGKPLEFLSIPIAFCRRPASHPLAQTKDFSQAMRVSNVTVLLGDNGSGKTTVLLRIGRRGVRSGRQRPTPATARS